MSRLLLWRSEVTNHCHFDFFELHSDPCTSNSIKREESGCKIWQLHWNFKYFTKLQSKIDEMFPFQFWWQSQSKQRIKGTAVMSKSASSMMLCSSFYQNTILLISLLSLHCSRFVCLCYPGPVIKNTYSGYLNQLWHNPIKNCFCCLASKGKDSCKASMVIFNL